MGSCVIDGRLEVLHSSGDKDEIGTAGREQLSNFPAQTLGGTSKENSLDSRQRRSRHEPGALTFPSTGNWFPFQNAKPIMSKLRIPTRKRTIPVAPSSN